MKLYYNKLKLTNMKLMDIANYIELSKLGSDIQFLEIIEYMLKIAVDNDKLATECYIYEKKINEVNVIRMNLYQAIKK